MARRIEVSPFDRAYEGVLEYIEAHGLEPGDRLPSERDLCVALDVSRMTLRSALSQLSAMHVVECRPGSGSFVCTPRPTTHLDDLSGFSKIVRKAGEVPRSRVLGSEVVACPDKIAPRLGLMPGDPVFKLRRVRGVEREAVCVEVAYVAAAGCPGIEGIDFARESLTRVLEARFGKAVAHTTLTVSVARATDEEAGLLGIAPRALVFSERELRADASFAPVEYCESVYVPERFGVVCTTVFKTPGGGEGWPGEEVEPHVERL